MAVPCPCVQASTVSQLRQLQSRMVDTMAARQLSRHKQAWLRAWADHTRQRACLAARWEVWQGRQLARWLRAWQQAARALAEAPAEQDEPAVLVDAQQLRELKLRRAAHWAGHRLAGRSFSGWQQCMQQPRAAAEAHAARSVQQRVRAGMAAWRRQALCSRQGSVAGRVSSLRWPLKQWQRHARLQAQLRALEQQRSQRALAAACEHWRAWCAQQRRHTAAAAAFRATTSWLEPALRLQAWRSACWEAAVAAALQRSMQRRLLGSWRAAAALAGRNRQVAAAHAAAAGRLRLSRCFAAWRQLVLLQQRQRIGERMVALQVRGAAVLGAWRGGGGGGGGQKHDRPRAPHHWGGPPGV